MVTAQITTQNEAVKNAIETQVVQLRIIWRSRGVKVEAVEVSRQAIRWRKNLDQNGQDHQVRSRTRQLEVFAEYVEVT